MCVESRAMRQNVDVSTPGIPSAERWCKGKLLVATPPLTDPNFDRTVIYVLEHTADGAVGVVLNRPLGERAPDELHAWAEHISAPGTLFAGGPVDEEALIALARLQGAVEGSWSQVAESLGSIDLMLDPLDVAQSVLALRVFRGYSGWGRCSSTGNWPKVPGWCCLPSSPMCSAATPPICGASCCAARAAGWRGWPTHPTTSARTDTRNGATAPTGQRLNRAAPHPSCW